MLKKEAKPIHKLFKPEVAEATFGCKPMANNVVTKAKPTT